MKRKSVLISTLSMLAIAASAVQAELPPYAQLGKSIFFDDNLSLNRNQSCASCHGPEAGWTGPLTDINAMGSVYEGSIPHRFGNRKPPSSAYATRSPVFYVDMKDDLPIGGNFWDGRATGEKLGNPAADQAQGPFLNPLEQALPDSACVVYRVCTSPYPVTFEEVWPGACSIAWPADTDMVCATEGGVVSLSAEDRARSNTAYDNVAMVVAAYEASNEVNAYTSKFDYGLAGEVKFTKQELQGLRLFRGKGKCSNCHIHRAHRKDLPAVFTDFTFDNLGLPRNPDNPFYDMLAFNPEGRGWVDPGLGAFLATRDEYQHLAAENMGKHKVPTLRNVDKRPYPGFVKAFGHNGYFKSLKGIVHFYNTRDVKPVCPDPFTREADALALGCWPEPEIAANVNRSELGDLKLTDAEEDAIVAFLRTLSDGYSLK